MSELVDSVPALCTWLPLALAGTILLTALLAIWLRWNALWVAVALGVLANVYLGVVQGWVLLHPGYDVLFMQPDPVLGWKHVPDLTWTWTGYTPYASEFSVEVRSNAFGFRDADRELAKPERTARVALLGASMIEALQVPLEETAGQVLERRLGADGAPFEDADRFEVLNFGVAAFGTGQALLVWETYARRFDPDVVFLYLSPHTFKLTVEEAPDARFTGATDFTGATGRELRVRPLFRIEGDRLLRIPPRDLDAFAQAQRTLIETEYGGGRSKRRIHSVLRACTTGAKDGLASWLEGPCEATTAEAKPLALRDRLKAPDIELNLRILQELGRQVRDSGSEFVVIDDSEKRSIGSTNSRDRLEALCRENGFGYVPFYADLQKARESGSIRWRHDVHFNRAGNEVLATAMHRWMRSPPRPASPRARAGS